MEKRFKRSLLGYVDNQVKNKIEVLRDEYAIALKGQEKELEDLSQELQAFEKIIQSIQQEIRAITSTRAEVFKVLNEAHLENTNRVFQAMKKAEQIGKEARETAHERQEEREKLKEELKLLTNEMQAIAINYNNALEAFRNGR